MARNHPRDSLTHTESKFTAESRFSGKITRKAIAFAFSPGISGNRQECFPRLKIPPTWRGGGGIDPVLGKLSGLTDIMETKPN